MGKVAILIEKIHKSNPPSLCVCHLFEGMQLSTSVAPPLQLKMASVSTLNMAHPSAPADVPILINKLLVAHYHKQEFGNGRANGL